MSVLTELNSLLNGIQIPVETGVFGGKASDEYVVITPMADVFELHANNRPQFEMQEARISLFSKGSYIVRKNQIVRALLDADFTITARLYVLTTKATKAIGGRYGGLENLGDKLMKAENFQLALEEIVWLITLLANQSILIYNIKHKDKPKDVLTEDDVELLSTPLELATYKAAITEAMFKGTARNIQSEYDGAKNTTAE
jgi:hypothetical protein